MNGLTFANASFWPWLLALGIPVLIHLLTRQTRRVRVLPTFQFLQRSLAQQSHVFRLRRWLLLALRLSLVLFLVLAFLKPVTTAPLAGAAGERRVIVVVLDTSLSMGAVHAGVSTLAQARGQAAALLEDLRSGDLANVVLADAAPHRVLPKLGGDFGTLRQALKSAQPTPERGDMPAAIADAAEQLAGVNAAQKELILASDFQRTNWADVKFDAFSPQIKLIFLNPEADTRDNTAVIGLRLQPATPRVGEEASVVAEVWNGTRAPRSLAVTLSVARESGAAVENTTTALTLPPYASGTATFPVTFPDAGRYRVQARVPADGLSADDVRYLAADLQHSLSVLLLTDANLRGSSGAYFLLRALNPTPDRPGGVRVIPKHATDLSEADLKSCDAVLLDDLTTLPADQLPRLYRYVADGGTLIVFLTGLPVIAQMQAFARLAHGGEGLPFVPQAPIDVRQHGKGYVTLTEARYDSPLLKIFKDPGAADLGTIHFTRFCLTSEPDPHAQVLLKFEDGTPAAARRALGAGSVLLCNFSPAPADSDLARQEVFPPLVHEFLKGMTAKEGERHEFFPGGLASATLDPAQARGEVGADGPNGEAEHVTVDRTSGSVIVERVETPGFHTILANGQAAALLAVNPHPDESDLRALDPRELEAQRSAHPAYLVNAGGAAALERLQHGRPLWPYCLLAAFAALLLEQAVATFGSQARISASRGS